MRTRFLGVALLLTMACVAFGQESRSPSDRAALEKKDALATEQKRWDDAVVAYRELVKLDDKNGSAWHHLGYSLHMAGKLDEAIEAHLKTATFPNPRLKSSGLYNAGCAYAMKKDKDKAFEHLMKAAEAGFGDVDGLTEDADLNILHDDPRWEKLVAAVKAAPPQIFEVAQSGDRKASRVAWFSNKSAPAAALSFGPVAWKDAYDAQIKSPELENKRWRLGKDFWTTLDTSITLSFGSTNVPPGYYYLTLERKSSGDYVLAFNDADAVKKQKLDAFAAAKTKGGIEVVLKHEDSKESAAKLDIALSLDTADKTKGALTIRFGPHKLSAPIAYQLAEK